MKLCHSSVPNPLMASHLMQCKGPSTAKASKARQELASSYFSDPITASPTPLQQHHPPCCFFNMLGTLLPQDSKLPEFRMLFFPAELDSTHLSFRLCSDGTFSVSASQTSALFKMYFQRSMYVEQCLVGSRYSLTTCCLMSADEEE